MTETIEKGRVVEFLDGSDFALGTVAGQDKKRIQLVNETGKRVTLPLNRILLKHGFKIDPEQSISTLRQEFTKYKDELSSISDNIDIEELWELTIEEEDIESASDMADLCFDDGDSPKKISGLLRALKNDPFYFKINGINVVARDKETVESLILQQKRKEEKKAVKLEFIQWLKNLIISWPEYSTYSISRNYEREPEEEGDTANIEEQDSITCKNSNLKYEELLKSRPENTDKFFDQIKSFAVHGDSFNQAKEAMGLINELNLDIKARLNEQAFIIMLALKVFDKDQDLALVRFNIPVDFSNDVIETANSIEVLNTLGHPYVKDIREELVVTIDDEFTTDVDDAVSLSFNEENKPVISVHITDISQYVEIGSALDDVALTRGRTLYLPVQKISMLPPILSENRMSLQQNEERPVLTFKVTLDEKGNIEKYDIFPSVIKVDHRLTYSQVDAVLTDDDVQNEQVDSSLPVKMLRDLYKSLNLYSNKRKNEGAVFLESREIKVSVDDNGDISIKPFPTFSNSRRMIAEAMIMAGETAARFFWNNNIPTIYSAQPPPSGDLPEPGSFPSPWVEAFKVRRMLRRAEFGTTPAAHYALGLPVYTQVTSPLRRYHDLMIHRQLMMYFADRDSTLDAEKLKVVAATAQNSAREAAVCERESTRYWLLKYMQKQKGHITTAHVLGKAGPKYTLELDETLLRTNSAPGIDLEIGSTVEVEIENSYPRKDLIFVKVLS